MKILPHLFFAIAITGYSVAASAQDGEQLFKSNCASCHMLGQRLVGPDLIGISERRSEEWLMKWIKSSQTLIKSGDEAAVKIYNEFNKVPMPDAFISDDEIKAVLGYVKTKGDEMAKGSSGPATGGATVSKEVTPAKVAVIHHDPNVTLLNMFSFAEYLLLGLLLLFLVVIWMLSRSIRSLSTQLREKSNL